MSPKSYVLYVDLAWDYMVDLGMDENPQDGDDITGVMQGSPEPAEAAVKKATIIKAIGPGGGNPFVRLEFSTREEAEAFALYLSPDEDPEEMKAAIVEE